MGTGSYLYGTEIHFGSVPSREGATLHSESIWREILGEIRSLGMNSPNFSCLLHQEEYRIQGGIQLLCIHSLSFRSILQTVAKLNRSSKAEKAGDGAIQGALKFSPKNERSWKVELALHPWKPFLQSPQRDKEKSTIKP